MCKKISDWNQRWFQFNILMSQTFNTGHNLECLLVHLCIATMHLIYTVHLIYWPVWYIIKFNRVTLAAQSCSIHWSVWGISSNRRFNDEFTGGSRIRLRGEKNHKSPLFCIVYNGQKLLTVFQRKMVILLRAMKWPHQVLCVTWRRQDRTTDGRKWMFLAHLLCFWCNNQRRK